MDPNIEALAANIKGLLLGRLGGFLDANKDRKDFLEERTKRLAELTVQLAKAATTDERSAIAASMDSVKDAMLNELYGSAVDISQEFKVTAREVLGTAVDWGFKIAPTLIKILASRMG